MKKDLLRNQKGVALVVALIMLLVLTLIGISAVSTTTFESNIVGNQRVYSNAFYAAECGIEDFRSSPPALQANASIPYTSSQSIGDGNTYRFKSDRIGRVVEGGNNIIFYRVTTEGTSPNIPVSGRVVLEAVIEVLDPQKPGYD